MILEKLTVLNIFNTIKSGIGLDISKNHTGIVIWNGSSIETYGFAIEEYDKSDYFAEYKMRLDFKNRLSQIVKDRTFEYCIVEDVYSGENFDTVRKLLALQTVMDELIFEHVCVVDKFVRMLQVEWSKYTRQIYKPNGRLKSKIETQALLEYLNFEFYMEHKDDSERVKKEIFFEDICDACAMLIGLIMKNSLENSVAKTQSIKLKDIKMVYVEHKEDIKTLRDKRLKNLEEKDVVDVNITKAIEKNILLCCTNDRDNVMRAEIPVNKLGVFGQKHKFNFYASGNGYLYFYYKSKNT